MPVPRWRELLDPTRVLDAPAVHTTEIRWILPDSWEEELRGLVPRERAEVLVDTYVLVPGLDGMSVKRRA